MILSKNKKVIYIGVPHTGSSFIHLAARDVFHRGEIISNTQVFDHTINTKHWPVGKIADHFEIKDIQDYKLLIFTRHPYTYHLSDWNLRARLEATVDECKKMTEAEIKEKYPDNSEWLISKVNADKMNRIDKKWEKFSEYLIEVALNHHYWTYSLFLRYNDLYLNDVEWLKFEDFNKSCARVFEAFGYDPPDTSEPFNIGKWSKDDITQAAKDVLYHRFNMDFSLFGYTKDDF